MLAEDRGRLRMSNRLATRAFMPHTLQLRKEMTIVLTQVNSLGILQAFMIVDMATTTIVVVQTGVKRTNGVAAFVVQAEVESPYQVEEEAEVDSNSKLN